jgi:hypothetical protein
MLRLPFDEEREGAEKSSYTQENPECMAAV